MPYPDEFHANPLWEMCSLLKHIEARDWGEDKLKTPIRNDQWQEGDLTLLSSTMPLSFESWSVLIDLKLFGHETAFSRISREQANV